MTMANHNIASVVTRRGIERLRHFTTNAGVTGVLATGELRSRDRLSADQYLDRIYYPNCENRYDPGWTGHVSISMTAINESFFQICSGSSGWHRGMDGFWSVIDLDPAILQHDGVWFATTNNRYSNVSRSQGADGLEALFAEVIYPYRPISRSPVLVRNGLEDNQPTDPQAEVLYPGAVASQFIRRFSVLEPEHADSFAAQVTMFAARGLDVGQIEVVLDPSAFDKRLHGLESFAPGTDVSQTL